MSKVLLQLANESYLVSPELAKRVQDAMPSDRYVNILPVKDTSEPPTLGQHKTSTVFEKAQNRTHPMTDRQKDLAQRMAKHLNKAQQPPCKPK
jgi:hypothetical protein